MSPHLTVFVRNRGELLLRRHPDDSEHAASRWDALSTPFDDTAETVDAARRFVRSASGLSELRLAYAGESVTGGGQTIYPVLFDSPSREVDIDIDGVAEIEWVPATALLDRQTVPGLWNAYEQVAPSSTTIGADTVHGAAALSIRALEALRDQAAVASEWSAVAETARELRAARPSMAVLANRINRVMSSAERSTTGVHDRAISEIATALDADASAAATAAERLTGPIATLSWSGTVKDALLKLDTSVTIAEARPDCEGIELAESLSTAGLDVTVTTDAALPAMLSDQEFGAILVGADTILPNGDVINKVGTRALALAADRADVPVYVAAARDKVAVDDTFHREEGPTQAVYDGPEAIDVRNPVFDLTPGELIDGVVTENGLLDSRGISVVAAQHRSNAAWVDGE